MMTPSSRRELYKLRELVHFLLCGAGGSERNFMTQQIICCFCHRELDEYAKAFERHGNSVGPKFDVQITVHHKDGNHDNNEPENKALCHTTCHKSYHRKEANLVRAQRSAGAAKS